MSYEIRFTRTAAKQVALCREAHLGGKVEELLNIIRENPFQTPPPCEKLKGMTDVYSRRLNIQHRMVCGQRQVGKSPLLHHIMTPELVPLSAL